MHQITSNSMAKRDVKVTKTPTYFKNIDQNLCKPDTNIS